MNNQYRRICEEDRKVIANLQQAGKTQIEIAQAIGFSQSAVSKELNRNRGQRNYYLQVVHRKAMERKRSKRPRPKVIVGLLKDKVETRLNMKHSLDQISKTLALQGMRVSH